MIDIHAILEQASKLKVAIIGDLIEDTYITGRVDRISPEAPIPVLLEEKKYSTLGGAEDLGNRLAVTIASVRLYQESLRGEILGASRPRRPRPWVVSDFPVVCE